MARIQEHITFNPEILITSAEQINYIKKMIDCLSDQNQNKDLRHPEVEIDLNCFKSFLRQYFDENSEEAIKGNIKVVKMKRNSDRYNHQISIFKEICKEHQDDSFLFKLDSEKDQTINVQSVLNDLDVFKFKISSN